MTRRLVLLLCAATLAGFAVPAPAAGPAGVLSPDGRWRAYVTDADELWLAETDGHGARRVLAAQADDDPKRNLTGFNNPAFSPAGRALFVLTRAWTTSDALHRVDLVTGATRFVSAANDFEVVRAGRHAGKLLVQKHTYLPAGGSRETWYLVDLDGGKPRRIGDGTALARFLQPRTPGGKAP